MTRYTLPNNEFFELKAVVEKKVNIAQIMKFVFGKEENILGKKRKW